jgi:hypothetical protein
MALLGSCPLFAEASVACNKTYCSNTFEKGCLQTVLNSPDDGSLSEATRERLSSLRRGLKYQVRVCNSYDPPEAEAQLLLDYKKDISTMRTSTLLVKVCDTYQYTT